MSYAGQAYAQPGVAMVHPGHPQMQFQNAAQARQYQQQQQQLQQHQQQQMIHKQQQHQQQQIQMQQMHYQQQQGQPQPHQVVQGNVVMVPAYARPQANGGIQRTAQPGQEYVVPLSTMQYVEHQPVAGPSNSNPNQAAGQQMTVMQGQHGHQQVQMAVPPGMTLQHTSQGRMIVVPLPVPHPNYPEGAAVPAGYRHPAQTQAQQARPELGRTSSHAGQLQTPVIQQGYTPTPRPQGTPGVIPGTVARPQTTAGDVLGSALSQGPLEHPTIGVGGNDPGGHPDGIVMIDGQAYSAGAVRERQQIQRHNMMVQQQQQQEQHEHELRARQQELSDAEEQAEAEMQMQLHLQRQAQAQANAQARAQAQAQAQAQANAQAQAQAQARVREQQQQLIQDRERDRTMQVHQQQQQQQQQQRQKQQMQLEQQQAQQRQQSQMLAPGMPQPSPAGAQPGQYHVLRSQGPAQGSPIPAIPIQSEAQIQQMREIQAQQIREIQIRQMSTPSSEKPGQARAGQISTAEAMAMRDREREMRTATDTPSRMRLAPGRQPVPGSAMSTPVGPSHRTGPGSEMASTAISQHSNAQSQAGTAVRLAQMQLQAGLGLGMPAKREDVDASSPAGYPPPRQISMVMQGEESGGGGTSPQFGNESRDFAVPAARMVSQSPMAPGRQGTTGPSVEREQSQMLQYIDMMGVPQFMPSGITIGLENEEGVVIGVEEDPGMMVHPAMSFGQATLRMMQFFERVRDASESSSFLAYQMLVADYFLGDAVLELTLTGTASREFSMPQYLLPRFFSTVRGEEAVRTAWNIANPRETYVEDPELPPAIAEGSPQGVALESSSLSWSKYMSNGAVVISHGACRAIWTLDVMTGLLKMHRLELALQANDDLVFRSAIQVTQQTPQLGSQLQVRMEHLDRDDSFSVSPQEQFQVKVEERLGDMIPLSTPPISIDSCKTDQSPQQGDGPQGQLKLLEGGDCLNGGQRTRSVTASRQQSHSDAGELVAHESYTEGHTVQQVQRASGVRVDIPTNPLDQYGMSAASLRFLDLASTFMKMVPLFDLSLRERISPTVALQQFVARDRVGLTNKTMMQAFEVDSPGSDQEDEIVYGGMKQDQQSTSEPGLQPALPVLSIRTNNLTPTPAPTPMFTSAFTTTPLSTYPPLTPQILPTPGAAGMNLVVGQTPRHSMDEMSATSLSLSSISNPGSMNGTQSQAGQLKRKLDRAQDQGPSQGQGEGGDGGYAQQAGKRVAPNVRKQSSGSTSNDT